MAQQPNSSGAMITRPTVVIGPQYCHPHPVDLGIVKRTLTITNGNFDVKDSNNNIIFKVKGAFFTFMHPRRVLHDGAGNPIVTLRKKLLTVHYKWQVYRGESTEPQDLLFSAKTSSVFNIRTVLDVFLASNKSEEVCDFKVKGNWFERSCTTYAGESSTVIAQMQSLRRNSNYNVTISPHIDHAFIIALIVIFDEISQARSSAFSVDPGEALVNLIGITIGAFSS